MEDNTSTLSIKYSTNGFSSRYDTTHFPAYDVEFTANVTDSTIYDWYQIFDHVLAAAGFTEYLIQKGAAESAFGELRNIEQSKKIFNELALEDFIPDENENGKLPDEDSELE